MKATELKKQIVDEYNLDSKQVEVEPMAAGVGYWIRFSNTDGMPRWLITFDAFYQISCSQIYILGDEVQDVIVILNIAADIMAKLESGELG